MRKRLSRHWDLDIVSGLNWIKAATLKTSSAQDNRENELLRRLHRHDYKMNPSLRAQLNLFLRIIRKEMGRAFLINLPWWACATSAVRLCHLLIFFIVALESPACKAWLFSLRPGLSVSDLCSLVTLNWTSMSFVLIASAPNLPFDVLDLNYLVSGTPHVSFTRVTSWITVLISLERCLCISAPLKVGGVVMCLFMFKFHVNLNTISVLSLLHFFLRCNSYTPKQR